MCNNILTNQKGVAVIMAIIVVSLGLAIVLGLSAVFINELFISEKVSFSTSAIYAADAGIERALYKERKISGGLAACANTGEPCEGTIVLSNGASFKYFVTDGAGDIRKVKAVGAYKGTNRALEISYPTP